MFKCSCCYVYVFLLLCMFCSEYLFRCVVLCTVCVYTCTVLLPPGVNPVAFYKIYHIISYHIIYHMTASL